jgi:hypothetical protein
VDDEAMLLVRRGISVSSSELVSIFGPFGAYRCGGRV